MSETTPGANVPQDWIGEPVLVSVYAAGGTLSLEGGAPLVVRTYRSELRAVNGYGVSLSSASREREEGAYYPAGDTFFPWNAVLRIALVSQ